MYSLDLLNLHPFHEQETRERSGDGGQGEKCER